MKRADLISLELPESTYTLLMAAAAGRSVTARMLLERLLQRAIAEERNAREARHRAEVSRQRRKFAWAW